MAYLGVQRASRQQLLLEKGGLNAGCLVEARARVVEQPEVAAINVDPAFRSSQKPVGMARDLHVGMHHFVLWRHHQQHRHPDEGGAKDRRLGHRRWREDAADAVEPARSRAPAVVDEPAEGLDGRQQRRDR